MKIQILEIARSFYPSIGGLEKFVSDRLSMYNFLGYDYRLLTTDYNSGKYKDDGYSENVTYLKQYTPYNICFRIKSYLDRGDYNFISVNQIGNYLSDLSIYHAKKRGKKVILTPHLYFHTKKHAIIKNIHKEFIASKLLKFVDAIVCFTEYEKEFYVENFNVSSKKIYVIPHYSAIRKTNLVGQLGDFILYLGRSGGNKRIDILIRAYSKLNNYPYKLFLTVESQDLKSEIQILVKNNPNIKLLGCITEEEKWRLLYSSRALILPTDYEAFGIVLLEASQAKKAILCSDLEIFHEVLAKNGVKYFNNTVNDLQKVLIWFETLKNEKLIEMGEINYLNLERYTLPQISDQYKSMTTQLLEL